MYVKIHHKQPDFNRTISVLQVRSVPNDIPNESHGSHAHNLLVAIICYICYDHASDNRSTRASPNFAMHGFTLLANKKIKHDAGFTKKIHLARKKRFLVLKFSLFEGTSESMPQCPKMPHKFLIKTVSIHLPIHRGNVSLFASCPLLQGFPKGKEDANIIEYLY